MPPAVRTSGSSSTSMGRVAVSSRRRLGLVCGARAVAAPSSRGGSCVSTSSSSGNGGNTAVLSASAANIDALVTHTSALSVTSATRGLSTLCRASATLDVEATEAGSGDADGEGQKYATAYLKGLRMGPNKVRRVAYAIRGRSYEEALMILEFMPYHACEPLLKLLYSAASNAKNMYGLNKSKLYISELKVDMVRCRHSFISLFVVLICQ